MRGISCGRRILLAKQQRDAALETARVAKQIPLPRGPPEVLHRVGVQHVAAQQRIRRPVVEPHAVGLRMARDGSAAQAL